MRSLLSAWLFVMLAAPAIGQDSIRTEVFVLSTAEPNSFVLIRKADKQVKQRTTRLEVRSNHPSVLRIEGINPLRYKYYINNEAVTQFMDASSLPVSINTFTNGNYFVTAPEIKVPEIFRTDSISTKIKDKLREFATRRKPIEDSISKISDEIDVYYSARRFDTLLYTYERDSAALRDGNYRGMRNRLNKQYALLERNDREYNAFVGGLPLSNPNYAPLARYKETNLSSEQGDDILFIRKIQQQFAVDYEKHIEKLKDIDSMLAIIQLGRYSQDWESWQKELVTRISYYSFTWPPVNQYDRYAFTGVPGDPLKESIRDLHQQMLNKRFQLYEEFVIEVATRIGVMVQNKFREYSSFNNELENINSVDEELLNRIKIKRDELTQTFDFIQQTSAELQVMVSYLDINTELYQSIAKKINNNYLFLLTYLKNLDFLVKQNTIQYTLPTHTNLRNIDLLRYTIQREDKITKNTQAYNYDFWVREGIKIDFSIGLFASRLTDNIYSKVLLDTLGGVDSIRITRQDDGRTNFAFGGMVHITPRHGASWVNVGGSIGVAYSNNQKLQVLTGISLHFGKTERIILNGGIAMGTIKTLDISASNFAFYNNKLEPKTRDEIMQVREKDRVYTLHSPDIKFSSYTIPTIDKFAIRPFIGFSYNLSRKNALQAVSGAGVTTFSENLKNAPSY